MLTTSDTHDRVLKGRLARAHVYALLVIGTFLGILPYALIQIIGLDMFPRPIPQRPMILLGGVVMALGGGLLSYSCMIVFVIKGGGTAFPSDPPQSFVVVGPYRWSRNPMYVGNLLLGLSIGIIVRSTTYLVYVVVLAIVTHFYVIRIEEPQLLKRFGNSYAAYLAATPRWIPRIMNRRKG